MTETDTAETVTHSTFTVERIYPVPPARVFAAFADDELKTRWFRGPAEWEDDVRSMDFRVGGHETSTGGPPGEWVSRFEATYYDIVADERIVYTYEMFIDDRRISVSLATIVLEAVDGGTRFFLTEQGVYLEGGQAASDDREQGTNFILDALGRALTD